MEEKNEENSKKKPKKKDRDRHEGHYRQPIYRAKYRGMKIKPKVGYPVGKYKTNHWAKGKIDKGDFEGKVRKNLSVLQKRNLAEFLKVREGETKEQWEKRTRRRRIIPESEMSRLCNKNPIKINFRKRKKKLRGYLNKLIVMDILETEYDYLRFYGIVLNYYSILHHLPKHYFEIGLYFNNNMPFDRERFENVVILNTGNCESDFNCFLRHKLIVNVFRTEKNIKGNLKHFKTGLYRLSPAFIIVLKSMYRTLARLKPLATLNKSFLTPLPKETVQIIHEMNDEINAILKREKEPILIKNIEK